MTAETSVSNIRIRPFTPDDYERIAAIENANFPSHPHTAKEMRFWDEKRNAKCLHARFVAVDETDTVVGHADYGHSSWMYHPRKFGVWVSIDPAYQRRGIGTLLYDHIMAELAKYEPIRLRTHGQEGKEAGLTFLARHGFVETMREWESRLTVATFDPSPFATAAERVAGQGIVIKTFRELESDPNRNRKMYDVDASVSLDMPTSEASSVPSYDDWCKRVLDSPNLLPDGLFIAIDTTADNKYVGISELWKMQGSDDLDTGATGILPEYRKRGIAMALKLRAIAYAKEVGAPVIRTWNAQVNRAMLSINEALGFVKEPAWIEYALNLREEPIVIRHATPRDYEGISTTHNAVWPEFPGTASDLRYQEEKHDPKMRNDRFVVERDGAIVAVGDYDQHGSMYHPQKFWINILVKPEYQGQGIGKALHAHLLTALRPFDPIAVSTATLADRERGVRFLVDRGFTETMREQTSKCDPARFDPTQYVSALARAEEQGIVIRTFAELKAIDPDPYVRLEELHWQIHQDIPHPEPLTRPDFAEWMKRFDSPRFLPEGNFIAIDTGKNAFVGASILWGSTANADLHTGMTGILPEYRKRGIATALKVRALTYAKERGATAVWTSNEVNNNGMLGINFRLGFEKQPEEILYILRLKSDA